MTTFSTFITFVRKARSWRFVPDGILGFAEAVCRPGRCRALSDYRGTNQNKLVQGHFTRRVYVLKSPLYSELYVSGSRARYIIPSRTLGSPAVSGPRSACSLVSVCTAVVYAGGCTQVVYSRVYIPGPVPPGYSRVYYPGPVYPRVVQSRNNWSSRGWSVLRPGYSPAGGPEVELRPAGGPEVELRPAGGPKTRLFSRVVQRRGITLPRVS